MADKLQGSRSLEHRFSSETSAERSLPPILINNEGEAESSQSCGLLRGLVMMGYGEGGQGGGR